LLAWRQPFHCTGHAALVELQETRTQLAENLAIDSLFQIGADFMGAGHFKLNRLAELEGGRSRDGVQFTASRLEPCKPNFIFWRQVFIAWR
jgi:hypothetical protein